MSDQAPIVEAILSGDAEAANAALAADPEAAEARDENGVSALLVALYHRNTDIADAIVEARAGVFDVFEAAATGRADLLAALTDDVGVDARSPDGFTPLHLACFFGHVDAVRVLLDVGAEVNAVADNPMKVQPLHSATAARNAAIVKSLLAAGADANAEQEGGHTAMSAAIAHGLDDIAAALTAAGAIRPAP
jgi:ankyrin repeat protein